MLDLVTPRLINLNDKTIWILTEERPKTNSIKQILQIVNAKFSLVTFQNNNHKKLKIKPNITNGKFKFEYKVEDTSLPVIIKTVKGNQGSFVDYLVFITKNFPKPGDIPVIAIEETKTTQTESRNTSVYQRLTKFVFLDLLNDYRGCSKIMMYNFKKPLTLHTSPTFVFGIKLMKTLHIEIVGSCVDDQKFERFNNLEEMIDAKNNIRKRKGNVSVSIHKYGDTVMIAAKLEKCKMLAHDPNIGLVTALSKASQLLDSTITKIIVTNHGLTQDMVKRTKNKFNKIATELNIRYQGLRFTRTPIDKNSPYWIYPERNENFVSILLHTLLEYDGYRVIFEHHSGAEQGYLINKNNSQEPVPKKVKKPDIVFISESEHAIYVIEAELAYNVFSSKGGISQLGGFTEFVNIVSDKYPTYEIKKRVICYGNGMDHKRLLRSNDILFQLKPTGEVMVSHSCPQWISNLFNIVQKTTTLQDYDGGDFPANDS